MKKGKSYKALYLPAWTIVALVLTLLLVIAVSTYRNMSRERGRMEDSLIREALVIIRAIEAGVRAGFPASLPDGKRLQRLIEEVAREPQVASISIFDAAGEVAATSRPAPGTVPEKIGGASSLSLLLREREMITRYRRNGAGIEVFEMIRPFRPHSAATPRSLERTAGPSPQSPDTPLQRWAADKMIALGLHLAHFETARREDRRHALLMGAILVVLGSGALFFIFIVQNYYLVDRSLDRMTGYMENVVESMDDGLISVDRDGRIVTLNRQAVQLLASSRERLEGRPIGEVLGAGGGALLASAKRQEHLRDREVDLHRDPDGPVIPVSLSTAPLRDEEGREMGLVLLVKDLREIRDLQHRLMRGERLASLGRLAAGVAHEIRNPLSSIRGFAQYFQRRFQGQAEEEGYASVMVSEVDRLNRVITELLHFAGPKEPRRAPAALPEIADHALQLLAPDLIARNVMVSTEYEPDLPAVSVDRDQISQVFLNLLLNAIESMPRGGEIRITLRRSGPPPAVVAEIADTGDGIPPEDLEKVFEPFFSRKASGTGLGLAIVHQIVESHRGVIRVESGPGGGTTFRVALPAAEGREGGNGDG